MGLISPHKGSFYVDKTIISQDNSLAWQRNIAHVPQNIYLSDRSFAENIAFGISTENINLTRIKSAAAGANIDSYVFHSKTR